MLRDRFDEKIVLGLLALIFVLSSGISIFSRSIWRDEAITLMEMAGNSRKNFDRNPIHLSEKKDIFSGSNSFSGLTKDLFELDMHPPVYYYALKVWRAVFGQSLEAARFLSLLAMFLSILVFLKISLMYMDRKWAIATIAMYALSPLTIYMASEARNYAVAVFVGFLSLLFAIKSQQESEKLKPAILAMFFAALAFLTNYLWLSLGVALVFWVAFFGPFWNSKERCLIIASYVLFSSISIPLLRVHLFSRPDEASGFPGVVEDLFRISKDLLSDLWFETGANNFLLIQVFVWPILVLPLIRGNKKSQPLRVLIFLFLLMMILQTLSLDIIFNKSISTFAHIMPAFAPFLLLLVLGTKELDDLKLHFGKIVFSIFFIGVLFGTGRFLRMGPKTYLGESIRDQAKIICSSASPGAWVVLNRSRGYTSQWVYELNCDVYLAFARSAVDSDFQKLLGELSPSELWVSPAVLRGESGAVDNGVWSRYETHPSELDEVFVLKKIKSN